MVRANTFSGTPSLWTLAVNNIPYSLDITGGAASAAEGKKVQKHIWIAWQLGTHPAAGSLEEIERNDRRRTSRCIPATLYLARSTTRQCC
ncbi:hypothetical protein ACOME3_006469 [Neoechinorhynchus agilis]